MPPVYGFGNSDATSSASDILTVKNEIHSTLNAIGDAVEALTSSWTASEAEMYYEIIRNWREGADGIKEVLNDVENALMSVHDGNGAVRTQITAVLNETQ